VTTNPPGLRFWRVILPKPPAKKYTQRRLIVDWVFAEEWPNHTGPLMSQDSHVILPERGSEFVFAMKDTHDYIYNAGQNKKTFEVSIEFQDAEGNCLSKTYLVPGLVD
jgi:hypothetical protein